MSINGKSNANTRRKLALEGVIRDIAYCNMIISSKTSSAKEKAHSKKSLTRLKKEKSTLESRIKGNLSHRKSLRKKKNKRTTVKLEYNI